MKKKTSDTSKQGGSIKAKYSDKKQQEVQQHNQEQMKEWIAPTSLKGIEERIALLIDDVPSLENTKSLSPTKIHELEQWCRQVYKIKNDFKRVANFLGPCLYKWATERTGISDQNDDHLISELQSVDNLLTIATTYCLIVYQPERVSIVVKEITEEVIVEDNEKGKNLQEINLKDDGSDTADSICTTISTNTTTPTTSSEAISSTPAKKRMTVKHFIIDNVIEKPHDQDLYRELVCEAALDHRELIIVALSTALKALKD